jgi:hypothetical protein
LRLPRSCFWSSAVEAASGSFTNGTDGRSFRTIRARAAKGTRSRCTDGPLLRGSAPAPVRTAAQR